jgi:hypothetical protein
VARFPSDVDDKYRPISDEERRLVGLFKTALAFTWKEYLKEHPEGSGKTVPARKMRLERPHAATRFFEEVIGLGDRGYDIAAIIIAKHMDAVERPVRSNLMTRMARAIPDCIMRTREASEREISQFGQVIDRLIADFPQRFLEWVEDMEEDDPWNDLKRQPTAIIRGAFLASSIDMRKTVAFWALAATSVRFPERMFSDPAESGSDGTSAFTTYHLRRYADLFAAMPDDALRRFATRMRTQAVTRVTVRFDPEEGRIATVETLTVPERVEMLRRIVQAVDDTRRRTAVEKALLNAPDPP